MVQPPTIPPRLEILNIAATLIAGDRNRDYGEPADNFQHTAAMLSAYLGIYVAPHEVAVILAIVKLSRLKTSPRKRDNWVDIAGYAGCGGETAEKLA